MISSGSAFAEHEDAFLGEGVDLDNWRGGLGRDDDVCDKYEEAHKLARCMYTNAYHHECTKHALIDDTEEEHGLTTRHRRLLIANIEKGGTNEHGHHNAEKKEMAIQG